MPGRPGDPRNTTRWRNTRAAILERDERTCQHCGSERRPSVHHITPCNDATNPLFTDHANLITLCPTCHHQADLATGAAGTGNRFFRGGGRTGPGDCFSLPAPRTSRVV